MPPKTKPAQRRADETDAFVGERIRAGRIMACLSQTELGTKIGVTFQQVQKYEKGVNRVGAGRMSRVADALNQPIAWFYGDDPKAAKAGDDPLTELGQTRDGVRLARAYNAIASKEMRHSILSTAEAAAA